MQKDFDIFNKIEYLTGSADIAMLLPTVMARKVFDETVLKYLNAVSTILIGNTEAKKYSDVITFAFWIRKANLAKLKARFNNEDGYRLGKGVVFHIAPSNVPVNFAYSIVAGLLAGNANVVRVSSKDFPQVRIIIDALNLSLDSYEELRPYVLCVRYNRDKDINDILSSFSDMRVVWGGDQTIMELRKSPLPPRSGEITFADRYSLAVIDSDAYLELSDKNKVADDFYNDTFLSDQNACTSPRMVIWMGKHIEEAKERFWTTLHALVKRKYSFQSIQGVNKLHTFYKAVVAIPELREIKCEDNLIVRVNVSKLNEKLMDFRENSGFFYEYDCGDIMELKTVCNDKRCQTVAYIGNNEMFIPLINSGIKGIDRIVPIGRTMDFDLIWDGYNLVEQLSRSVALF